MSFFITALLITATAMALALVAIHFGFKAPRIVQEKNPGDYAMDFELVKIPTSKEHLLNGWLMAAPDSQTTVVLMHGWGGNAEMTLTMAQPLYDAGYEVLVYDARNHGLSPDDGFSSLPKFSEDTSAAVDWMRTTRRDPAHRVVLVGHSIGAAAVLLAASKRDDIAAVVSVSAFAHPDKLMRGEVKRLPLPEFMVKAVLKYVEWRIGYSFDEIAPMNTLCRISCPVLLSHGDNDRVVPFSDLELIARNCGGEHVTTMAIEGADHYTVEKIEAHGKDIIGFLKRNDL